MSHGSGTMSFYRIILVLLILLSDFNNENSVLVQAQICASTCPPLVNGVEIPSVCEGNVLNDVDASIITRSYTTCHPTPTKTFTLQDYASPGRITVIANLYSGCNAGRRESGVFAHVAQRYYDQFGSDKVTFIISLKGGGGCIQWPGVYQSDAVGLYPNSGVVPNEMPLTVDDTNYELRDDFFTTPFPHPSYVILDENLTLRHKFVGPCCGYIGFYDCTADNARTLDATMTGYIDTILEEQEDGAESASPSQKVSLSPTPVTEQDDGAESASPSLKVSLSPTPVCTAGNFSTWSVCSLRCPTSSASDGGMQFRYLTTIGCGNQAPVEVRDCDSYEYDNCDLPDEVRCIPEVGSAYEIEMVADGFDSPRDVAFHPTPGLHLGDYSEGRSFSTNGDEAWVANGGNHSVSIVTSVGTNNQTALSRRDRGYYHYTVNITALSFNKVSDSGRTQDRDSFNYWALCNDNRNDYLGSKEANYFMGPTLYNSDPKNRNTVNRLGQACAPDEPCHFLHSDMLHESPACIGIVHDPETITAFGTVYWAFDSTGDNSTSNTGQLVRFDFQQPHGPGSMDHSVAAVRRYPEVELKRGPPGVHAGMVIDHSNRAMYIASPGDGSVVKVMLDSGTFARTAREEYPIYSNKLPSFEYSIWECAEQHVFASDLDTPSGMALSDDGERLFVAEHGSGNIHVFETSSGALLTTVNTIHTTIGGMALSPTTSSLHFVDATTNSLFAINPITACSSTYTSAANAAFQTAVSAAAVEVDAIRGAGTFSLTRDYSCETDPVIPDTSFFDQVHVGTGYASNDTNVQANQTGMDDTAYLLASRTDCEYNSDLNFDALLLGGYYCHTCLPGARGAECDSGGGCTNLQWEGYTCDNEFVVTVDGGSLVLHTAAGEPVPDPLLEEGITYRFTVRAGSGVTVSLTGGEDGSVPLPLPSTGNECGCASEGPLILTLNDIEERVSDGSSVFLHSSADHTSFEIKFNSSSIEESVNQLCFSSRTMTHVMGKGTMSIDKVEVGDRVLTANGNYEMVYSFDHRHQYKSTPFLQIIHAHGGNNDYSNRILSNSRSNSSLLPFSKMPALELTADHMLFLEGKHDPVPARSVRVGDNLDTVFGPSTVIEIRRIARNGLFNPLTTVGTIVANGVLASSYTSQMMAPPKKKYKKGGKMVFGETNNNIVSNSNPENGNNDLDDGKINEKDEWVVEVNGIGNTKFTLVKLSHQLLVHKFTKPYRIFCSQLFFSSSFADNINGICQPGKNQEKVVVSEIANNLQKWVQQLQQATDEQENKMVLRAIVIFFIIISVVVADAILSHSFLFYFVFSLLLVYIFNPSNNSSKRKKNLNRCKRNKC